MLEVLEAQEGGYDAELQKACGARGAVANVARRKGQFCWWNGGRLDRDDGWLNADEVTGWLGECGWMRCRHRQGGWVMVVFLEQRHVCHGLLEKRKRNRSTGARRLEEARKQQDASKVYVHARLDAD